MGAAFHTERSTSDRGPHEPHPHEPHPHAAHSNVFSRESVACFWRAAEKPAEPWVIRKERKKCAKKKETRTALWKSGKRKKRVSHFPTGPATSDEERAEETKTHTACGRTRSGPAGPRLRAPLTDSLLDPFIGSLLINPMVDPACDPVTWCYPTSTVPPLGLIRESRHAVSSECLPAIPSKCR